MESVQPLPEGLNKSCPFCGSSNVRVAVPHPRDHKKYAVLCYNEECMADGPTAATQEEAVELWQSRKG